MDRYSPNTPWGRLAGQLLLGLAGLALPALAAEAQSPGDLFNALLAESCSVPNNQIGPLCSEFNADGGVSSPGGGVGNNNNFDTLAAQNQSTASTSSTQSQTSAESLSPQSQPSSTTVSEEVSVLGDINVGVFATVFYENRERKATILEEGYDGDVSGALIGINRRFTPSLTAGLTLRYSKFDADYDNNVGTFETDGLNTTAFATYSHADNTTATVYVGYENSDYSYVRNITVPNTTKIAQGDTDSTQLTAGVALDLAWPRGAWLWSATLRADYRDTRIDTYSETSLTGPTNYLLTIGDQDIKSLTNSVGGGVAYTASTGFGVLVPQLNLRYVHESENDGRSIGASISEFSEVTFVASTDEADTDYLLIDAGATAVLKNDWQLFAQGTFMTGNDLIDSFIVSLGFHKQF